MPLPKGATVTVGRDHSKAARALNRALAGALTAAGLNIRDLRAVTSALVRNDTARYSDGGVILRTTPGRPDSIDVLFLNSHGGEISSQQRESIERIFTRKTGFVTLDRLLARLHANKRALAAFKPPATV